MRYLPVMLDLAGRSVLVVGGGAVATRKARRLLEAGAHVRVVAVEATESLRDLADSEDRLELHLRGYRDGDLDGVSLAFTATGRRAVDEAVSAAAGRAGLWVNAADDLANCSFLMPAMLERGRLQVSVSTGGASPALASRVRDEVDSALGPEYQVAADLLGELRSSLPAGAARGRAFAGLLDDGLLEALRQGDERRVARMADQARRGLVRAASRGGDGDG